MTTEEIVEI